MTNGDKIRQMSNEELAKVINDRCYSCSHHWETCDAGRNSECEEGIKAYLDMEVEE